MDINQAIKEAAEVFITEQSGTSQGSLNDSVIEALKLYVTDKGGTPANNSINDLINQATAYYFAEQSVSPAPRGNDAIFKATELYLTAKSEYVPKSFNERLLASAGYFITNGSGTTTIDAPFASVNGPLTGPSNGPYESWSVESATPISDDTAFDNVRQGYTASASVTSYTDRMYVTRKVRQPYPNHGSLSSTTYAVSDYIYSTDTPSGSVTNNATQISPVPICNWVTPHRSVVGSTIGGSTVPVEVVAYHRNARLGSQVACVVFSITDGTTTVTCTPVSTTVVSNRAGDQAAVLVYQMPTTDISSLSDNVVLKVRAQVYPWIGAAASVADSDNGTENNGRDFGPRYFYRNTGLAAAPYYAYVKTGGTAGGVFSTTAATAEATPFGSIANVMDAINSGAAGKADGVIVRLGNDGGTPWVITGPATSKNQDCAAFIITRDPNVARANARCSWGAASFRPRLITGLKTAPKPGGGTTQLTNGIIRFTDVQIVRTGALTMRGETASNQLELQFDNVDIDPGTATAAFLSDSHSYFYGATFTAALASGAGTLAAGTNEHRIFRGVSVDVNANNIENYLTIGSTWNNVAAFAFVARSGSGGIFAFNRSKPSSAASALIKLGESADINGFAVVQNVFEWISTTTGYILGVSNDSNTGNNTHIVIHNNTGAGAYVGGRCNLFYDEGATARTSKLHSVRGNCWTQLNTKGDVFVTDGTRIGNWAYLYGVGCQGEWAQYIDANSGGLGTSFAQAYPGVGSSIGTTAITATANMANSNFTDFKAVTVAAGPAYTGGAGGGTYSITSSSAPVKGIVSAAALSHDLLGNARSVTGDTAGAYA